MKCLNCGSQEFFQIELLNTKIILDFPRNAQIVTSYACKKCGHVELFIPQEIIDDRLAKENRKFEAEKLKSDCSQKIEELKKQIADLELIIKDENQTVKAVKQAQEELTNKQKDLNHYITKLNSIGKNNFMEISGRIR